MKRPYPLIRMALLFALLLGSLTMVVWRQGEALEELRRLDAVRAERVIAEAHRASLRRRVEQLESRARVAAVAREELGMRLPSGSEIVILPMGDGAAGLLAQGEAGSATSAERSDAEAQRDTRPRAAVGALARHVPGPPGGSGADPGGDRDEG